MLLDVIAAVEVFFLIIIGEIFMSVVLIDDSSSV